MSFDVHEYALHDDQNVCGFFGEYRWMSNFFVTPVEYRGIVFGSSEAAYQAAKCAYKEDFLKFENMSPSESKKVGRTIRKRRDWDDVKITVMREIVFKKFLYSPELAEILLQTGDKHLEERNHWKDRFWGTCDGEGENHLGKILMDTREYFKTMKR